MDSAFLVAIQYVHFSAKQNFIAIVIATESTVSIMLILLSVLLLVCHGKTNARARLSVYVCCVVAVTKPNCPDGCLPLSCCMHLALRSESIRGMVAVCSCCSYLCHYYHWAGNNHSTHTQRHVRRAIGMYVWMIRFRV